MPKHAVIDMSLQHRERKGISNENSSRGWILNQKIFFFKKVLTNFK
jgi:hypothetical protein